MVAENNQITILGLGLIGGSLGSALVRKGYQVTGWDQDPASVTEAFQMGVINRLPLDFKDAVHSAGVIFVATPAAVIPEVGKMLHTYIAYCPQEVLNGRDLGFAYNRFMEMVSDEDWVCFLDHDAMFTTSNWYHQISVIINEHPGAGEFAAKTNRINNRLQVYKHKNIFKFLRFGKKHDIKFHRKIGNQLQAKYGYKVKEYTNKTGGLSGVVIVTSKKSMANSWRI